MISLITTFFLILPFLTFKDNNSESKYVAYASSLAISYASLGLLSLVLIFLKLTFLPIYIILIILFLLLNFQKKYRFKLYFLFKEFSDEIKYLNSLEKYKKTLKFFYILIIILLVYYQ